MPACTVEMNRKDFGAERAAVGEMLHAVRQLGRGILLLAALWGAVVGGSLLLERATSDETPQAEQLLSGLGGPELIAGGLELAVR
jgi:hypothetical protein